MKSFIKNWGLGVAAFILCVHFLAQMLSEEYRMVEYISKALFLPSLMLYLYVQSNPFHKSGNLLVMIGLLGSFLGDVFLISNALFIIGMIAFMMTHIFNIIFFWKIYSPFQPRSTKLYISKFVLVSFCIFIYFQLKDSMGALIYPILIYMILICSSALMTVHISNYKPTKTIANKFWIPGMLFFVISDTVLAFNKFDWSIHSPIPNIGLLIMLTYGLAQLLLVKGFQSYFTTKTLE